MQAQGPIGVGIARKPKRAKSVHFYRVCGLSVESEIALLGLNILAADRGPPDVTIRRGAVPAALAQDGTSG